MQLDTFFKIIVIVYSIILHEIAHGYAAYLFGDKTAFYKNRLTLNPLPHIDLVGSIIVPAMLILSGSSILAGWAKPVPVSEHNLNPYKLGSFVVSSAGIMVNLLLMIIFAMVGHFAAESDIKSLCLDVAIINMGLAIFNLIPVPPADGYRIASIFLNWEIKRKIEGFIYQNFFVSIILAIFIATEIFRFIFPLFLKWLILFVG